MFCLFSSFIGSWFTISFILIIYILLAKPGRFLLDLNPIYLRLPLPNVNDKIFNRNKKSFEAIKIENDKIITPKSLALDPKDSNRLYIGSATGYVYCLQNKNIVDTIASFSDGRPLGIRLFRQKLYFIEANSGLYAYDLDTKLLTHLLGLDKTKFLDGKPSKFFDDLVVVEENDDIIVYITDVSRKFSIDMWCYTYLEPDSTGRILRYSTNNQNVTTILENLCFPNGIEITDNNQSLLICELTKRRIIEFQLNGTEKGKCSVLMDNLPGEPENIRRTSNKTKESYWVGLALTRDYNSKLSFMDDYSDEPNLRKLILRSCFLLGTIMHSIGNCFGSETLKTKGSSLKTGIALILDDFMKNPGMAIEIDRESNVLLSFQIKDDISVISEINESYDDDMNARILYTTSSGGNLNRIILKE
ncbi:LOW QUALITY PROTEIN: adipocyte plasma membrane-associated protein [Dermatophagoides farinae]|uniref:Adipocyte plasma membrane-associated protein-like protein n=1 Tax=Dermatophagoides farinae TaxID=6954 RepID=A0A9D4NXW4_DERFA|nr:adipocyte plasma membrane-associated protein-like protein [Dermatophagoides farinae]